MKTLLDPEHIEKESFESEESFEEYLNDCYEPVSICGMTMDQGTILKECDPIAFRCAMNDSQEYTDIYVCPICGDEYEDEDEAKFCCQDDDEDMSCNQCQAMMINGVYCHETGCPNTHKVKIDGEWIEPEKEDEDF
jgi:hypothetical protein